MIYDDSINRIREEFPYLDPTRVYFDHAAVSPMSKRVKKCIGEFIHETHEGIINNYMESHKRKGIVRSQVSKLISAPEDRIAFVKSTTDGMVLLARGFQWKKGDRILLHREEFPSNIYPWYELKHYGVKIDFIDTPLGHVTPEDLERSVKQGTRIISISWVQYLSGCRNDIKKLAEWCHSRNIFLAVDGMQGLGAIKMDVEDSGIDFLASGTAKWLMGPHGTGFIYISEELQNIIHPPHLGWLSRENVMDFHNYDQPLRKSASRYEFATESNLGIYGLNGALDMILEVTPAVIESRIHSLSDRLIEILKTNGFEIHSPRIGNQWSGIVTCTTGNNEKNSDIHNKLLNNDVLVSFRGDMLRVSPHFYNTFEDLERFAEKLGKAVK